jgi:hypothetical protein
MIEVTNVSQVPKRMTKKSDCSTLQLRSEVKDFSVTCCEGLRVSLCPGFQYA